MTDIIHISYTGPVMLKGIINLSFEPAKFPVIWKLAKIFPLYKKGDKEISECKLLKT